MKRPCRLCEQGSPSRFHRGGEKAHVQSCRVCGGDEQTMGRIEDVNPQYLCADEKTHDKIRQGFADAELAARGNPPVVHRAKKPNKAQTTWLEQAKQ